MKISTKPGIYVLTAIIMLMMIFVTAPGCKKSNDSPTSPISGNPGGGVPTGYFGKITLNGDGFNNLVLNVSGNTAAYGAYIMQEQATWIILDGMNGQDSVRVVVTAGGKQTGTFTWVQMSENMPNNAVGIVIGSKRLASQPNSGSTIITAFGNEGGAINGSFSGKMLSIGTGNQVDVSATFSAYRYPDE